MQPWRFQLIQILLNILCGSALYRAEASILNSVFGLPNECVHHNVIHHCKWSLSCWLQGGKHTAGCGSNKWLLSCCVLEKEKMTMNSATAGTTDLLPPTGYTKTKHLIKADYFYRNEIDLPLRMDVPKLRYRTIHHMQQNILRRRIDESFQDQEECGIPRTSENTIQKRIIGGRVARFAEYPWQAHIRIAEYQCGGVLVSIDFIVTAGHCIEQARIKDIVVFLGELDTQNTGTIPEPLPAEKHRVIKKIIHPRFQLRITQPDRYDLGLLQLAIPTSYKNHILPICLPTSPINLIGRRGLIAGWGKVDISMGHTGTAILQTATVPIINSYECIKWHEKKQISVELHDEMFCAGYSDGHQDACLGDSGGPLILMENGRFTLIGITSAGFGCGVDHQPGIYHNVQKTTRWIQNIINRKY